MLVMVLEKVSILLTGGSHDELCWPRQNRRLHAFVRLFLLNLCRHFRAFILRSMFLYGMTVMLPRNVLNRFVPRF
jgi:hypothetical protein